MVPHLLLVAAVAYAIASGFYLGWMLRFDPHIRRYGVVTIAIATAVALAALITDFASDHALPLSRDAQVVLLVTIGMCLAFVIGRLWRDLPLYGVILAPIGAIILLVLFLKLVVGGPAPASSTLGAVTVLHIGSTMIGFLLFLPAYVLSILFLHQEYRLKTKQPTSLRMPLLTLEKNAWRLLFMGFPLYSIGILLGALWKEHVMLEDGSGFKPQHVLAAIGWCLYAVAIFRRLSSGWRGRPAALCLMSAFVVTLGAVMLYSMR